MILRPVLLFALAPYAIVASDAAFADIEGATDARSVRDADPATARVVVAQSARNANVWDGQSHQPTAADVGARERRARIAPADPNARAELQELDQMGGQLSDRAGKAPAVPHTVQPGGVVPTPPSTSGTPPSLSR